jgi:hypothetical protein
MSTRQIKTRRQPHPVKAQHQSNRDFPDHTETTSDRARYQQAHQRKHTDRGEFGINDRVPRLPKLGGKKK